MYPSNKQLTSYGRFAILLLIVGVLLAVDSLLNLSFLYKLWPLIITMLGIGFIGIFRRRARKEVLYLTVGIYLVCFSGLSLYCNFASWSVLASLWPLFIAFFGVALIASFLLCQRRRSFLLTGLVLLSLSTVFFLVFSVASQLWWTVFILVGLSILISEAFA